MSHKEDLVKARELKQELKLFIKEHNNQIAEIKQKVRSMRSDLQDKKAEAREQGRDAGRRNKSPVERAYHLKRQSNLRSEISSLQQELLQIKKSRSQKKLEFKVKTKEMKKTIDNLRLQN